MMKTKVGRIRIGIKSLFKSVPLFSYLFCILISISINTFAKNPPKCGIKKFKKYQMQYCLYEGPGPLLVLEAPLGDGLTVWPDYFLNELNKFSTILVYSRIGIGKSYFYQKKVQDIITAKMVSEHLHNLLNRLHINKPMVFIAHSIGGIYVQYFIRNYPQGIAGLVLIDADSSFEPKVNSPFQSKTPGKKGSIEYLESMGFNQSMDEVNDSPHFPNIPLLIITATNHGSPVLIEEQWDKLQKGMLKQSNQGKQVIAYGSGHYVYIDKPDLVIREIHDFIKTNHIR